MGATTEPVAGARAFPTGTVTFLFTDLEGSTALQQASPDAYRDAVLGRIRELGLEAVVHIREFTSRPEVAYRALDISITASTNET